MKNLIKGNVAAGLLVLAGLGGLASATEQAKVSYQHTGKQYPPVFFVTNIDDEVFKQQLEGYQAFSKLDSKAVGLPIGVRILKGHRSKQDATSLSSAMLSASTLGLIPLVSNKEFKVYYEVFVQGKSIAKFKYQMDTTDVDNLWTVNAAGRETKPSEALFIQYTLPKFLTELKSSSEVQAVFQEYWDYFDES